MEGNYLFEKWCEENGHPKSYTTLQKLFPDKTIQELDIMWDAVLALYKDKDK
jgi:hypothetical protein